MPFLSLSLSLSFWSVFEGFPVCFISSSSSQIKKTFFQFAAGGMPAGRAVPPVEGLCFLRRPAAPVPVVEASSRAQIRAARRAMPLRLWPHPPPLRCAEPSAALAISLDVARTGAASGARGGSGPHPAWNPTSESTLLQQHLTMLDRGRGCSWRPGTPARRRGGSQARRPGPARPTPAAAAAAPRAPPPRPRARPRGTAAPRRRARR